MMPVKLIKENIMRCLLGLVLISGLVLLDSIVWGGSKLFPVELCAKSGAWFDPKKGSIIESGLLFQRFATKDIVLLGENHATLEHQLWQTYTIAGLYAIRPKVVVGFEMFPRSVQKVLNMWSAGALTESDFLSQSRWSEVWGFEPDYYMPLFLHVRQNRIPIVGLNVERRLISRIGKFGWSAIPEEEKEGVTKPARVSRAYEEFLAEVFRRKIKRKKMSDNSDSGFEVKHPKDQLESVGNIQPIIIREDFQRFVAAQSTWDRAMAQALVAAKVATPDRLVIGVLGRGHIEHGYGVPHQLADLGFRNVAIALPVEVGERCQHLAPNVADAVFLVDRRYPRKKNRRVMLGVYIEPTEKGVRIKRVLESSVASKAGLQQGDIIYLAAGRPVKKNLELIQVVDRQATGTWLPLEVLRGTKHLSLVAKFPAMSGD